MAWAGSTGLLHGDHLQPFMVFMYPHSDVIYQGDNAAWHWAQALQNWLGELSREF